MRKLALLSNINTDFILKLIGKKLEVIPSVGYGNVWGQMLDPNSSLNAGNPGVIVFIIDIEALLDNRHTVGEACNVIDEWFSLFDPVVKADKEYFISDLTFRSGWLTELDSFTETEICSYWLKALQKRVNEHGNVHVLRLNPLFGRIGTDKAFSDKLWYMAKIPYSNEGCMAVADAVEHAVGLLDQTPKKVLVLDMDNTLWGGILGELGAEGICLSDDHLGALYKTVQRKIMQIKDTGTVLAIASKNNESDVREVWDRNPHMLLKREDFVSVRINWNDKADNIKEIAEELNLGLDSFVFIDDMAPERDNIRLRLPGVAVPEFPEKVEDYPRFIDSVYEAYFKRIRLSDEDRAKTRQYAENAKRAEASRGLSFEEFIASLDLKIRRVEMNEERLTRIVQLHGKTNQFNLTTRRYGRQDIDKMIADGYRVYAYDVSDKFGDYGLVAVAVVDRKGPEIVSFLMSCRIMGKLIENFVIDDIEKDLLAEGFKILNAKYIRTAKNAPVEKLYDSLGYEVVKVSDEGTDYRIDLTRRPIRKYFVNGGEQ